MDQDPKEVLIQSCWAPKCGSSNGSVAASRATVRSLPPRIAQLISNETDVPVPIRSRYGGLRRR